MTMHKLGGVGRTLAAAAMAAALPLAAVHAQDTIKIGAMAPLSSPGSYQQGPELLLGIEWAIEEINAAGGLLGKQVEMVTEDTQGRPPTGATAVEKLITKDGIVGAAGEYHSSVCTSEIEVFHRYGIPFVIGSCWADSLTEKGYDEIFRTSVYSSKLAENMAGLIKDNGFKKVVALVEDTDYGVGTATSLEKAFEKLGVTASFEYEVVEKTSKDFLPVLLKYKTQVKPDLIIYAVTQPGGFLLLKQMTEIAFAPSKETMVIDGTCTAQNDKIFWEAVQDGGKYVMMSCPYSPGVKLTAIGEKIKAKYMEKFGRTPNYLPLQGYDAAIALLEGIKKAGTTEPKAIVAAMKTLEVEGARGPISFSSEEGVWHNQWRDVPTFIFQYTEVGQLSADAAVLYPPAFATAPIMMPE